MNKYCVNMRRTGNRKFIHPQELLRQAEKDLQADMTYLLNEAIRAVGVERGYACILNTDGNTCPFINPAMGDDVSVKIIAEVRDEHAQVVSSDHNKIDSSSWWTSGTR